MADNPVTDDKNVVLYDDLGNKVNVILTDGVYRLAVQTSEDSVITTNPFPGISFSSFLTNGGSSDMAVDGSVTPVEFVTQPPTGKRWYVHTLDIIIEDNSMNFSKFGGLPALTNGVDFFAKQNGAAEALLGNIKRNGDFYIFANDAFIESSTTDLLVAHIRTRINTGTTFKLDDSNSEFMKAVVNDDLLGIDVFQVLIRGYEVDE